MSPILSSVSWPAGVHQAPGRCDEGKKRKGIIRKTANFQKKKKIIIFFVSRGPTSPLDRRGLQLTLSWTKAEKEKPRSLHPPIILFGIKKNFVRQVFVGEMQVPGPFFLILQAIPYRFTKDTWSFEVE